jgi:uncharacterized protein YkwD
LYSGLTGDPLARSDGPAGRGRIRGPRLVEVGRDHPREFALGAAETTIGSDSGNQIVLAEPTVSRRHAIIRRTGRRFTVADLESSNGTFVNGRRVAKPVRIQPGDEIKFASSRFRLEAAPRAGVRAKFAAFMIVLGAAMGVIAVYQFKSDWQQIESAEDYVASPTPTASAMPIPAASAPTASPTPTVTATSTPSATRTPRPRVIYRAATPRRTPRPKPTRAASPAPTLSLTGSPTPTASPSPPAVSLVSPTRTITPGFPTPVPIPPPSAASDWLGALNAYRAMARLDPVAIDPKLSAGDLAHAKYLVINYASEIIRGESLGGGMHREDPSRPGYSEAGREAGLHSDVNEWIAVPGSRKTVSWAIDSWMTGPFHRANLLNPALHKVGYGEDCERGVCVAVMNTLDGADTPSAYGTSYDRPIEFPSPIAPIDMRELFGEWPNPLTSCPGYSMPAGLPITLQIGANVEAKLTAYSLTVTSGTDAGAVEPACGFDATSYTNPERLAQDIARGGMKGFGQVIVVPKNPLLRATRYRIEMTVNGKPYTWTFTTAP